MKGYKGMKPDMTCRGFQYEIGKTYKMEGAVSLCERGFHFCEKLADVFSYYSLSIQKDLYCDNIPYAVFTSDNRFFEIEASGMIINGEDKSVSSEITILRELTPCEIYRAAYEYGYGNSYEYGNGDGHNSGYTYGNGDGWGCAYGDGYGDGYGNGYGDGSRCGIGDGSGCGDGNAAGDSERVFQFI